MLPVSGAEQLNTSDAIGERPMISHKRRVFEIAEARAARRVRQEEVPQALEPAPSP